MAISRPRTLNGDGLRHEIVAFRDHRMRSNRQAIK